jgi:hypothetical protein
MLSAKAGSDPDLNSMSIEAELIFLLTIPHLDRDGLIAGDPIPLWGKVVPRRVELMDKMGRIIQEWVEHNLVVRYEWKDGYILFFKGFRKHNINMTYERELESDLPPPPGFRRLKNIGLIPNERELAGRLAESIGERSIYHAALVEASNGTDDVDITLHVKSMKNTRKVHDEDQQQIQQEVEVQQEVKAKVKINNNTLADFARKEAEYVDGFVGVDAFISTLDSRLLRVFIEWCWLCNNIYAADPDDAHDFVGRYKQHPFKGIDNRPGYIRAQTNEGIYPYLHEVHKKELEKEIQDAAKLAPAAAP